MTKTGLNVLPGFSRLSTLFVLLPHPFLILTLSLCSFPSTCLLHSHNLALQSFFYHYSLVCLTLSFLFPLIFFHFHLVFWPPSLIALQFLSSFASPFRLLFNRTLFSSFLHCFAFLIFPPLTCSFHPPTFLHCSIFFPPSPNPLFLVFSASSHFLLCVFFMHKDKMRIKTGVWKCTYCLNLPTSSSLFQSHPFHPSSFPSHASLPSFSVLLSLIPLPCCSPPSS